MMRTAVLLLNFGEPEEPAPERVIPFLERIFAANASLMGPATPEQVRERSRRLAEARAPGLIEAYVRIGGSPLHRQAREQARALEAELAARGHGAAVLLGMQFTEPSIPAAVERARELGAERVVALPVYPLAGPSTTAAALAELDRALAEQEWAPEVVRVAGWHAHPAYVALRAAAVRRVLEANALSLDDPETKLVFSAHGTPLEYLEGGSRYRDYVVEFCDALAGALGAPGYALGYQNHANRPGVRWTEPESERVIAEVDARRVVVDAVSFMHEQSETLDELDHGLRARAEERGLEFHRVPIPHDDPAFISLLAELVLAGIARPDASNPRVLAPCRCFPAAGTLCANAAVR